MRIAGRCALLRSACRRAPALARLFFQQQLHSPTSTHCCTCAFPPPPAILGARVKARSLDDIRRHRKECALTCALWMSRALLFVGRFGSRLIGRPASTPTEVAKEVYMEVLRRYHGFLVANIVSLAFSMAPGRVDFFTRIGGCTEEEAAASGELAAFVKHVLPCVEALHAWFVAKGYNFPDVCVIVSAAPAAPCAPPRSPPPLARTQRTPPHARANRA